MSKFQGTPIFPVPDDAPKLSQSNAYKHFVDLFKGEADHHYPYKNQQGQILGYILRWDAVSHGNGTIKKEIRPFIYCEFSKGKKQWCSQGFPNPRPLFNLDKLTERSQDIVLIVEGEKTAQSTETLFPTWVTTTTMQGAQSAKQTDYAPLKDRHVIIAMDADEAGLKYGKDIYDQCQLAGARSVQFLNHQVFADNVVQNGMLIKRDQPEILTKGYDLADALNEGWKYELLWKFTKNTKTPLLVNYEAIRDKENQAFSNSNLDHDAESLKRLASLSAIQYDRVRKTEAKDLGISVTTLDQEVEKLRIKPANANNEEASDIFPTIEPWANPVSAEELLQELSQTFKRFAILPEHADTVLALWVIFTWLIDHVGVSPILAISSPEKRCGKTTVISILGNLVCKPILASNISAAALFRTIELWKPTIIIDEADTFIRDSDELRGIINSGHTRYTAYVIRTTGEDHTPRRFSTWGAKAIAIIGSLPDTLHDRAIVIQLRRKLVHEKVEKLRHADTNIFVNLQRKLLRFANDSATSIEYASQCFPEHVSISDRALDNWEPLLAIAKLAGNAWIEKVYQAARHLSNNDKEPLPIGTELLKDIEQVFKDKAIIKIHTVDLIHYLCEDEESPWSMYNFRSQDKKITPRQLSKLLAPYQITTKNIEIGGVQKKGFDRQQFKEVWERYNNNFFSEVSKNAVHPSTIKDNNGLLPSTITTYPSTRPENINKNAEVDGWTAKMEGV